MITPLDDTHKQVLERHSSALRERMDALQRQAREMLRLPEFNIGSPQQVSDALYTTLQLRKPSKFHQGSAKQLTVKNEVRERRASPDCD